jgi:hypothetical protein
LFSTTVVQVSPSMKRASQYLHMVCLSAGLSRILVFRDTDRKSVTMRREAPVKRGFDCPACVSSRFISEAWVRYVAAC